MDFQKEKEILLWMYKTMSTIREDAPVIGIEHKLLYTTEGIVPGLTGIPCGQGSMSFPPSMMGFVKWLVWRNL